MATEWYYTQGGSKCGPVDSTTLKTLVRSGKLLATDLVWREGMAEWRPAGESKTLFEGMLQKGAAAVSSATQDVPSETAIEPSAKAERANDLTSSIGGSVVVASIAAVCLHALQWFLGWGWGSLWAMFSSVFILSCGIVPWMRDHEGTGKQACVFGAAIGGLLGVAYGWLTGGLMSGILFCASIGTCAAWGAHTKGLASKAVQAGVVAAALVAFHGTRMLSPSSAGGGASSDGSSSSYDEACQARIENAKQIPLGMEYGNIVAGWGPPFSRDYADLDHFVAKWAAGPEISKSFIAIEFTRLPGRPGLTPVLVQGITIHINGRKIYAKP